MSADRGPSTSTREPVAVEMVDGAREAALPAAHVGLHSGPVLFQEGATTSAGP